MLEPLQALVDLIQVWRLGILVRAHPTLRRPTYYLLKLARGVLTIFRSVSEVISQRSIEALAWLARWRDERLRQLLDRSRGTHPNREMFRSPQQSYGPKDS